MKKFVVLIISLIIVSYVVRANATMDQPGTIARPGFLYTNGNPVKGLQYYADQCKPALPNNGILDDAAPLRQCMAAMPAGATMNLDGIKPYYFASHSTSDPVYGSQACETYVESNTTLKLNGATITQSPAESAVSGIFMICGGSLNFNNPGASGGSPTFDAIANTAANATSVTLSTPAHATNYHTGDDLYIDCGSNAGNADVFVGWDQVNDTNSSTGVVNLKYPLRKPYNYTATGCGSGATAARIYDWTTSGGGASGANLGPLAHNVYIEGPGTLITGASDQDAPITMQGAVQWGIDYITAVNLLNGQFAFANNNHLGHMEFDVLTGQGCSGDTNFNPGEFTASINEVSDDKVTLTGIPGTGCGSSTHEVAYGDAEGDEDNHYDRDTATVLVGLSSNPPNLGACWFSGGIWGETIDHMECLSQAGMYGIIDTIGAATGALATQGPITLTDSHLSTSGNAVEMQVPDDIAIGNTLDCPNSGGCLYIPYWSGKAIGNTINLSSCSGSGVGILIGTATNSQLVGNTIHAVSGTCTEGIDVTGSGSGATLVLSGNSIDQSGFGSLTNVTPAGFPDAVITSNPGIPDYNTSGASTPLIQYYGGSFGGVIAACQPMVLAGVDNGVATVNTPGASNATGVVGFNPGAIPQNTSGQTAPVVLAGTSCGKCDGTCTLGDIFEMSQTSAIEIHDIGTTCSGATAGAQVGGILGGSGTAGSTVSIILEPGLCNTVGSGGTVSSVGLALPSSILTVTGSPVTSTGTLTGTLATQTANTIFAGPTSGSAAAPTFRAQVDADLPLDARASKSITFMTGAAGL